MNGTLASLRDRLDQVRSRIAAAARRSGRSAEAVVLVAVVKLVPVEVVREGVSLGLTDLGENRVQEAEAKREGVSGAVRWHSIGHLQRNKAKRAVSLFDVVHGVDDQRLAEDLARHAREAGRILPVLVQVNVSGESTKHGVAPEALEPLLEAVAGQSGLELQGLMSIGPPVERSEEARPFCARTRELRDRAQHRLGIRLPQLSMGMSGDYEVAIEEGSTMVRVGTALFGPRA